VVDWETVREIALALPEAEDASGERPAFRVRGKLFAWKSRPRDGGALAVRVDPDEKHLRIEDAWLTRVPKRLAAEYFGPS